MSVATLKPIWLECHLPTRPTLRRQQSGFVLSRQAGQIPAALCIGFECCCNGQNVSNRTFIDMMPLWEQRDKNYLNRDLKPKLWDEIGEKLNVAGKYWNNSTNETGYNYLLTYSIFNIGTFYIRMVTVVTNIYLSYILYITNVPIMWC